MTRKLTAERRARAARLRLPPPASPTTTPVGWPTSKMEAAALREAREQGAREERAACLDLIDQCRADPECDPANEDLLWCRAKIAARGRP